MGTDIDSIAEVRDREAGGWRAIPGSLFPCGMPLYERNYGLFGILNGHRWWYGRSIACSDPDGRYEGEWPGDISDETRAFRDGLYRGAGIRLFGSVTLAQLDAWPWDDPVHVRRSTARSWDDRMAGFSGRLSTWREEAGQELFDAMRTLHAIAVESAVTPEDVRILFTFDC